MAFPNFGKKAAKQGPPVYEEEKPAEKKPKASPFGGKKSGSDKLVEDKTEPYALSCPGCGMHLELKAKEEEPAEGDGGGDFGFDD